VYAGPGINVNQAPTIELSYTLNGQRYVTLSGRVTDENPGGLTVSLGGQVNASVVTNPDGTFSWFGQAAALGEVTASTTDTGGLSSNVATVTITYPPPSIVALDAHREYENNWVITGRVGDTGLAGLPVAFSGLASVDGKTAMIQADGTFRLAWTVAPGESGWVTATLSDWWGQTCDDCVMVDPTA
jgi:hypothetical protein